MIACTDGELYVNVDVAPLVAFTAVPEIAALILPIEYWVLT